MTTPNGEEMGRVWYNEQEGNMKIYVITEGLYSDYHIVRVFIDKEKAEDYERRRPEIDIEEFDTDEPVNLNLRLYCIWIKRNGIISSINKTDIIDPKTPSIEEKIFSDNNEELFLNILARSRNHAIKIAGEIRAQIIALNQWPEEPSKSIQDETGRDETTPLSVPPEILHQCVEAFAKKVDADFKKDAMEADKKDKSIQNKTGYSVADYLDILRDADEEEK